MNYNKMRFNLLIIFLALLLQQTHSTIFLQMVQITQSSQTFTIPYTTSFALTPSFAYYIESGEISSTQFVVGYSPASTAITQTQLVIAFEVSKTVFTAGEYINIQILVTDQNSQLVNIGLVPLNIATSTLSFNGFTLSFTSYILQIFCFAFPMNYTKTINTANNQITIAFLNYPVTYYATVPIYFSYVFYTNIYSSNRVIAMCVLVTQINYGFLLSYSTFAFAPSDNNVFLGLKTYSSTLSPFFSMSTVKIWTSGSTGSIRNFVAGYSITPTGVLYSANIVMFNSSQPCTSGQYLYYLQFFTSLPYSCIACHSSCETCFPSTPSSTDADSCLSCPNDRYMVLTNSIYGRCNCSAKLGETNGICNECEINCLTFQVVYIQSTNQSNFLLYFSMSTINQQIGIEQNLKVTINGFSVKYESQQQDEAIYIITLALSEMNSCDGTDCSIMFQYMYPEKILTIDGSQYLRNKNYTIIVSNFINYYDILPSQLKQAFTIMGIVVMGTYTSGYTSLVKILFELQQLIDAHKYLNLTLPIIFNQLIENLQYFKFMDLTYLMPLEIRAQITGFTPNDLNQLGNPKLIYYENGVNYASNIIPAFISLAFMLLVNYIIYLILKFLPFTVTKILAKKISKRKIITIHDSFDALIFPIFFFATTNLEYILMHANLFWVYGFAGFSVMAIIVCPFFVVIFIYNNRKNEQKVQIYEDLMQDNSMNQSVTYVYYIFNFYRKIFFGLCLTDTLPGLIQIYLLICLNTVHLAFQIYLIAAKTYKSKSKVIVRLINSLCVIAVQILIIIYNLNWYQSQVMINIGLSCFYLSVITALLNIIDAIIKLFDTITQEIRSKQVIPNNNIFQKHPILKEFTKQIICNIGDDIPNKYTKDMKQNKFILDKELMQNTIQHKQDQYLQEQISERVSQADNTKSKVDQINLVYIDDDWMDIYPPQDSKDIIFKQSVTQRNPTELPSSTVQLFQIPPQIDQLAKKNIIKKRQKRIIEKRQTKYDVQPNQDFQELPARSSKHFSNRTVSKALKIRPINQIKEDEFSQVEEVIITKK